MAIDLNRYVQIGQRNIADETAPPAIPVVPPDPTPPDTGNNLLFVNGDTLKLISGDDLLLIDQA